MKFVDISRFCRQNPCLWLVLNVFRRCLSEQSLSFEEISQTSSGPTLLVGFDDSEVVGQEQELVSEEPVCYARVER